MVISFLLAMLLILVGVVLNLTVGLSPAVEYGIGGAFVCVAVYGAILQFSERCPVCRFRIGLQSRLLLPPACPRCGATFRPRPSD
jgi:hypothetical protein